MAQNQVKLKVAILDDRKNVQEKYRDLFSRVTGEKTLIVSSKDNICTELANDNCNAIVINLALLGAKESIELLQFIRDKFPHIPICVIDNYSIILKGKDSEEWNIRLNHYYQLPFNTDQDDFEDRIINTVRLFEFYLTAPDVDYKLRQLREFISLPELNIDPKNKNKIVKYVLDVIALLQDKKAHNNIYINPSRIREIEEIRGNNKYDLSKLIEILKEINSSYQHQCLYSVIALTRILLDHIPPIFNCKNFDEVANNYPGGKSFKKSMRHLKDSCRNIADHHIHNQVRQSETLLNETQINFSNDLDVLLSEIVRLLKV